MTTCVVALFHDSPWPQTPTKSSDINCGRSTSAEKRGTTHQIQHYVLVTFGSVDGHGGPTLSPPLRWIALTSISYSPLRWVGSFKKALWENSLKLSIGLSSLIPEVSKPCPLHGFQLVSRGCPLLPFAPEFESFGKFFIYEYEIEHLSGHRRRPHRQLWWVFMFPRGPYFNAARTLASSE
jgi:hypothetical protein